MGKDFVIMGSGFAIVGNGWVILSNGFAIFGNGWVILGNGGAILGSGLVILGNSFPILGNRMVRLGNRGAIFGNAAGGREWNGRTMGARSLIRGSGRSGNGPVARVLLRIEGLVPTINNKPPTARMYGYDSKTSNLVPQH